MNKLILLSLLIFLALAAQVHANLTVRYNQTTNTVGNSIWNETWTSAGNKTFYVNLPKNATVVDAKLNLSGYANISNYFNQSTFNFINNSNVFNCGGDNCDWSIPEIIDFLNNSITGSSGWYPSDDTLQTTVNYTLNFSAVPDIINFHISFYSAYGIGNQQWDWVLLNMSIFNYTSNNFKNFYSENTTSGTCIIKKFNTTIENDYIGANNNITLQFYFYGYDTNDGSSTITMNCDGKSQGGVADALVNFMINTTYYSQNPYLDVSGDGDAEWSFSGSFNQTNNQTSDFSNEINSYLKTCYPYIDGTCDVPFILHSDSAGIMKVRLNATITYDSETFDNSVYEGQTSNFWVKVNSTPDISNVNAWLVYNGTSYAYTTKSQDGSNWTFTKALTIPSVNADTNISFYWNFTYSNATGTYAQNFSSNNQTVYVLKLYNCTSGNITLNFTGYDEISKALINYKMDSTITYWPPGKPFTKNFSYSYTGNNTYYVCIAPSTITLYADAIIKYWNDSYSTRYYYLQNATLTNSTQNISLYLLNSSSSTLIAINVLDQLSNPQADVVVMIEKENIGNGSYSLVAEAKTDYSGTSYTYLKLGENYKVLLASNGTVLREYNPFQLQSTSLTFYISQSAIPEYFSYIGKVATSCNLDNSTNTLICSYVDTSGLTMNMTLKVTQTTQAGDMDYCLNSSTGTSGSFVCNLAANYSYKYSLTGTYYSTPTDYLWQSGFANLSSNTNLFGEMGLIISLIFIIFMPFLANWDVRIALLLQGAGIIISLMAGFIFGGSNTQLLIILVAVIEGVVIYKVKTP
jgi:hypothetical protein